MITAVAFLCLAAAGAMSRALIGHRLNVPNGFPLGTLVVNVTGSVALGLLHELAAPAYTVLGVGMLGAFTTFSSFVRDGTALVEEHRSATAAGYLVLSLGGAILGAALGVRVAQLA